MSSHINDLSNKMVGAVKEISRRHFGMFGGVREKLKYRLSESVRDAIVDALEDAYIAGVDDVQSAQRRPASRSLIRPKSATKKRR